MATVLGWILIAIAMVCLLACGRIVTRYNDMIDRASGSRLGGLSFLRRQRILLECTGGDPLFSKLLWAVTLCGFAGAYFLGIFDPKIFFPADNSTYSGTIPPSEAKLGDAWTNPLDGSLLVYVPPGEFTMGSNDGALDEKPDHQVYVDGFWIGKYPVTNQQFKKFVVRRCDGLQDRRTAEHSADDDLA